MAGLAVAVGMSAQAPPLDVLVVDGQIVDGTGAEPFVGDVHVRGDRIVAVQRAGAPRPPAARVIDATGLVVAPGFIDPHTHALEDLSNPARRANVNYLMQGVTTVFAGNDGEGPLDTGAVLRRLQERGVGTNVALFVGHGTVRRAVMGMSASAPSAAQLERMKALVGAAVDGGALGLSTGLYYAPGSFARTEEVVALARVVASKGGVYDTHMRDESSYTIGLLGSIEETLRIGRDAGLPVHISHIKCLGTDVWRQSQDAIALIQRARAEGTLVTADQYPYDASGTSVGAALLPRWAEEGGRQALLDRIADAQTRRRLLAEMEQNLARRGGAGALLITGSSETPLVGKRLDAIAREKGVTPLDAAIAIIAAGDADVASFNMTDEDIVNFMRQDWVMTGSDGSSGHPRKYGTFPRKFAEYVFRRHVLSLTEAVRVSSALTAETFRLVDRGRLFPNYFADIVIFDRSTFIDRATYEEPDRLATGVKMLLVNGVLVIEDGKYGGKLAGRALKKRASPAPA
ncbi:MAG: amidohydrolase family protein [Vicinamibacterales bacterium]